MKGLLTARAAVRITANKFVMPALVAGIHVAVSRDITTWMAGSSPAMTMWVVWRPYRAPETLTLVPAM